MVFRKKFEYILEGVVFFVSLDVGGYEISLFERGGLWRRREEVLEGWKFG